jgi:hypothetical protein
VLGPRDFRYQHGLDDQRGRHDHAGEERPKGELPTRPRQREHQEPDSHQAEQERELPHQRQLPSAAAVGDSSERASRAHQPEKHAGECKLPVFRGIRGHADLEQTERRRIAQHHADERNKSRLRERAEPARASLRLDAPGEERRRPQEEERADRARCGGEEHSGGRRCQRDEKGDDERADDKNDLDQHRLERVRGRKQAVIGEALAEVSAQAYRNRRKARPRCSRQAEHQQRAGLEGDRRHQTDERRREGEAAGEQSRARPRAIDQAPERWRERREADDVARGRGAATDERLGRRLHQEQDRQAGNADREATDRRGGDHQPHFARLEQRGVAGKGNH